MKLRMLAASVAALATLMSVAPAEARQGGVSFEAFNRVADTDKDGMLTKKEFLEAMGKMYDMAMVKMKSDPKMVKGNMMTMDGVKELLADLYKGS